MRGKVLLVLATVLLLVEGVSLGGERVRRSCEWWQGVWDDFYAYTVYQKWGVPSVENAFLNELKGREKGDLKVRRIVGHVVRGVEVVLHLHRKGEGVIEEGNEEGNLMKDMLNSRDVEMGERFSLGSDQQNETSELRGQSHEMSAQGNGNVTAENDPQVGATEIVKVQLMKGKQHGTLRNRTRLQKPVRESSAKKMARREKGKALKLTKTKSNRASAASDLKGDTTSMRNATKKSRVSKVNKKPPKDVAQRHKPSVLTNGTVQSVKGIVHSNRTVRPEVGEVGFVEMSDRSEALVRGVKLEKLNEEDDDEDAEDDDDDDDSYEDEDTAEFDHESAPLQENTEASTTRDGTYEIQQAPARDEVSDQDQGVAGAPNAGQHDTSATDVARNTDPAHVSEVASQGDSAVHQTDVVTASEKRDVDMPNENEAQLHGMSTPSRSNEQDIMQRTPSDEGAHALGDSAVNSDGSQGNAEFTASTGTNLDTTFQDGQTSEAVAESKNGAVHKEPGTGSPDTSDQKSPAPKVQKQEAYLGSKLGMDNGENATQLSLMVYKIAKNEKIFSMAAAPCRPVMKWMPEVAVRLELELPGFQFFCVDTDEPLESMEDLKNAFGDISGGFVQSSPEDIDKALPKNLDLVVSWMGMQYWGIRKSWRFIKGLRRSGVRMALFSNNPRSSNANMAQDTLNVRKSPLLFNEPSRVIGRVSEDDNMQLLLYSMDGLRDGF